MGTSYLRYAVELPGRPAFFGCFPSLPGVGSGGELRGPKVKISRILLWGLSILQTRQVCSHQLFSFACLVYCSCWR
jgi:hypothetical protein